jgi:LysM repeat protein
MNTKLLGLLAAAALTTASCSQEKTTTETTVPTATGDSATVTTTTTTDTAAYRTSADALAARVAQDLKITDPAVVGRIKNEYYARGRELQGYTTKYATDTTGEYAATRAANDQATANLKSALTADQYKTYTTNQGGYYSGPYTVITTTTKPSLSARVGQGSGIKKLENTDDDHKVKYENGAKIKRSDDGSLKIKRADGTKIKIDEDGHRTVKKGLL